MYRPNLLKKRLLSGGKVLGCWATLGHAGVCEILALAGYDFLLVDQEHGIGEPSALVPILQAISATPCTAVIRVPANDPVYLKRVLDIGVEAVMIPGVDTVDDAKAAVAACRYPPQGRRGSATGSIRAANYGLISADYAKTAADNTLIICQIESAKAVDNVDAIGAVEGVDVLFLGPNDLSGSIGKLGQFTDPQVLELLARAETGMKRTAKAMGAIPHAGRTWQQLLEAGYAMMTCASDAARLRVSPEVTEFRAKYG
jgi:4-hydroxy-2-oxoheptanedioate aldolase